MSDKKEKYVLVRAIRGRENGEAGSVVELTAEQAKSPLYRRRVRKADVIPATPRDEKQTAKAQEKQAK